MFLYAFHCLLFSLLITWALITHDQRRIPLPSVDTAPVLGSAAPLLMTDLLPLKFFPTESL